MAALLRRRCFFSNLSKTLLSIAILSLGYLIFVFITNGVFGSSFSVSQRVRSPSLTSGSETVLAENSTENLGSYVLDVSGTYRIFPSAFRRQNPTTPSTDILVLVTHCSPKHLRLLPALIARWAAPASVAVFVEPSQLNTVVKLLKRLRHCDKLVRQFVSFHIVSGLVKLPENPDLLRQGTSGIKKPNCEEMWSLEFSEKSNYEIWSPYPNNLLRNVGRRFVQAIYVLVVDIDIIPSTNLRNEFVDMMRGKNRTLFEDAEREVFVIPAFEIQTGAEEIPERKPELLKLVDQLVARPFYFEMCWKCHKPTDYEAWQKLDLNGGSSSDDMRTAYHVLWKDPWEPFFISDNEAPFYDERFKQYGFNRISQACELHIAGYTFSVLNNAFLVHLGFKTPETFHGSKLKELNRNRQLFAAFKQDMTKKYPDSSRKCW